MGIARRQFLQAGLTGLLSLSLLRDRVVYAAETYASKLSVATQRKRALLIGINQYDAKEDGVGWLPLRGCVNDVQLQRELLVYRFGFAPQDVVTLTDREATRSNIVNAIAEHLAAQTLPEDLVVIHFSGMGSRLGKYNTLLPVDAGLPEAANIKDLMDITEQEWQIWLQSIGTDRLINVIDAGFHYPNMSVIGNFRLRSRQGLRNWQPDNLWESISAPKGITFKAVTEDMLCADAQWSGFSSGAFTYALVQQMWQISPATTIYTVMGNIATTLERCTLHNQNLTIEQQVNGMLGFADLKTVSNRNLDNGLDKFFSNVFSNVTNFSNFAAPSIGGDAVVTAVSIDSRLADLSLSGLPIAVLSNYAAGGIFKVVATDGQDDDNLWLQLRSRNGFTGKAEVIGDRLGKAELRTGMILQEAIRAVFRNVKLAIAIDSGFSKIERIDATSALSTLPNMFGVNPNEQCADCLFGAQSASYGLFSVGHTPILGSFGSVGESVGVAIKRLQPFLESLLAAKLIRLTENQATSHLDVRATLKANIGVDHRSVIVGSKSAARSLLVPTNSQRNNMIRTRPISIGDRLECQIENFSDRPLYVRIFCFDTRSKLLTPNFITTPYANDGIVAPSEILTIPYPQSPINWSVSAPKGLVDIQVVVSRFPLLQVAKSLEPSQRQASSINGLIAIANPLQVAQSLLNDLDLSTKDVFSGDSSLNSNFNNAIGNNLWLDVEQWATFNFSYQVV